MSASSISIQIHIVWPTIVDPRMDTSIVLHSLHALGCCWLCPDEEEGWMPCIMVSDKVMLLGVITGCEQGPNFILTTDVDLSVKTGIMIRELVCVGAGSQ